MTKKIKGFGGWLKVYAIILLIWTVIEVLNSALLMTDISLGTFIFFVISMGNPVLSISILYSLKKEKNNALFLIRSSIIIFMVMQIFIHILLRYYDNYGYFELILTIPFLLLVLGGLLWYLKKSKRVNKTFPKKTRFHTEKDILIVIWAAISLILPFIMVILNGGQI